MSYPRFTTDGHGCSTPRAIITDAITMHPPVDADASLVAELMGVPAEAERPAQIVAVWQEHWDEHGYGTWIIRESGGDAVGFVGLRAHAEFIRLTLRTAERAANEALEVRALRLASAHAIEWLPDLPIRMRVAPEDAATRSTLESAGMAHVADLDHTTDEGDWQVLELPYVRVAERIPSRAGEAMLAMWVEVNDAGGAVGFLPGASAEEVAPVLDGYASRMQAGGTACVSLNSPVGDLLGFGFLVGSTGPLTRHGATLERIMTDPATRGTNHGALLMAGLHRAARERGVELVTLDYRGGTGLGEFYTRYGYTEVGRVPGALRVAAGDDRDGVIMARSL
ncbi:GNAT family N-acetyltransferase [Janibacter alittae]|uniref:GNAT family N-acetyltransferase n=1 Tax=Janibacter alittae TaxID=3115209 RepID=A0ABZ2ME19_9MICO